MEAYPPSIGRVVTAATSVAAIAIALRMPSCYESLWLDELHSAWTVWGDLSDVLPRASVGHQSPLYFFGLWFWKQVAGASELGLRMSSVLATSLACAILTIGVARWSKSLIAGLTAGLVLAMESNSIFYGTELRPYPMVILLASIATTSFLALSNTSSRFERPGIWSVLLGSTLVAAGLQPTSIGVLGLLPLSRLTIWFFVDRREITRFGKLDAVLLLAILTLTLTLWQLTLKDSWQERSQWALFGSVTSIKQLTEVWNWFWLLLTPLGLVAVAWLTRRPSSPHWQHRTINANVLLLSLIAVIGTCLYWLVAWFEFAPLWHRRYFISVLPIFAVICGGAIGAVVQSLRSRQRRETSTILVATLFLVGLGLQQRTLPALARYPVALAIRGEDWRGAIEWVNQEASEADRIYLDPDLIESNAVFRRKAKSPVPDGTRGRMEIQAVADQAIPHLPTDRILDEYLLFPIRGPYRIAHPVRLCSFSSGMMLAWENRSIEKIPTSAGKSFLVLRRAASQLKHLKQEADEVVSFGRVSIVVRPGTGGSAAN